MEGVGVSDPYNTATEHRRLKDQFSVDAIWTDEASKERCKAEAVTLLQLKGCDVFRHTEGYDIERDQRLLRTDGWMTELCKPYATSYHMRPDGLFYKPRRS